MPKLQKDVFIFNTSLPFGNLEFWHILGRASWVALVVKNLPASAGNMRCGFDSWLGKIPWRRT